MTDTYAIRNARQGDLAILPDFDTIDAEVLAWLQQAYEQNC
jgi:hypothetical protein